MKSTVNLVTVGSVFAFLTLSSCSMREEMPAKFSTVPAEPAPVARAEASEEKAPAKAKAEKARGDVGLLDTEKNYMILVTKEGKLITLDFDEKTKVTQITPTAAKVEDIGLGSSATVTYGTQGEKNIASILEYTPAKSGD
ncbi:MAG: hypothetical protein OEN50_07655 [Deltaproteobacteria bacterium]|nr:hypothetical protein [Deltaproteobacteria bacterium]